MFVAAGGPEFAGFFGSQTSLRTLRGNRVGPFEERTKRGAPFRHPMGQDRHFSAWTLADSPDRPAASEPQGTCRCRARALRHSRNGAARSVERRPSVEGTAEGRPRVVAEASGDLGDSGAIVFEPAARNVHASGRGSKAGFALDSAPSALDSSRAVLEGG
jgi:hypothetical protein